jgi:hypothetical protein
MNDAQDVLIVNPDLFARGLIQREQIDERHRRNVLLTPAIVQPGVISDDCIRARHDLCPNSACPCICHK